MMGNDKQTEDQVRVSENLDKVAKELGVGIQAVALADVQQKVPYVFPIVYVPSSLCDTLFKYCLVVDARSSIS